MSELAVRADASVSSSICSLLRLSAEALAAGRKPKLTKQQENAGKVCLALPGGARLAMVF